MCARFIISIIFLYFTVNFSILLISASLYRCMNRTCSQIMSCFSEAPLWRLWPPVARQSGVYISWALVFMPCHPWEHLWWFLSVFCFSCWAEVWGCNIVCASKAGWGGDTQGRLLMNNGCKNNRNKKQGRLQGAAWPLVCVFHFSLVPVQVQVEREENAQDIIIIITFQYWL